MGIFSKPEVIFLKTSSDSKNYLEKLEELKTKATGDVEKEIQKEIAITKAGIFGEENIMFELKNSNMDMAVLRDIYIETEDGRSAQIDFIVVTAKLIFVIECKNLFGSIEIDSKGNFIRTMEYNGRRYKEGIYSPITQNERHMAVLKEKTAENKNLVMGALVRNSFDKFYRSIVVLANPKTVLNDKYAKKDVKEKVFRADQMIKVMKQMNAESNILASSKKDIMQTAEAILARNTEQRPDYFQKYEQLLDETVEDTPIQEEKLICPKCGSELILRTAKKGERAGKQFYGCSNYPQCRYILNIE